MDFIIKLLKFQDLLTKEEYNIIFLIVDRLTKYSYLISFTEKYIVE